MRIAHTTGMKAIHATNTFWISVNESKTPWPKLESQDISLERWQCRTGSAWALEEVSCLREMPVMTTVSFSLQSRDLIADSVESVAGGHWLDGMIVIPGCDKNMPGTLMALGRLNRPGFMVYGGTIRPGTCGGGADGRPKEVLDIVSAFQSYGKYLSMGQTEEAEKIRYETVRNACPGAGACGGVRRFYETR